MLNIILWAGIIGTCFSLIAMLGPMCYQAFHTMTQKQYEIGKLIIEIGFLIFCVCMIVILICAFLVSEFGKPILELF